MMVQYVCSSTLMQVHITISTYPAVSLNKLRVAIDGNLMSHVDYPGCWKQNAPRGSCTRSCKLCATGGALDVPNRAKSQFLWELVVSTVHAAAIAAAGPVQYSFFFPPGTPFLSLLFNLYKLKILLQVSASWTCLSWRKTRKRYLYSVHYQKLRHAEKHLAQWSTRSLELQAVVGPLAPASIGENTWLVSPGWSVAAKLVNPRILRTVRCYCMQWYAVESKTDHLEGFEGSRHRKPALSWKLLKMLLDNDFHANHFRLYPGHNICIHIHNIEYTNIPIYLMKIVAIDQNQSW